jgi:hypothetical protein
MKTEKRPRGRPKKKEGAKEFWRFCRDGMVMSAYNEARESGQKHSAAVTQAFDYIRKHFPGMPISGTEVKRTVAAYQPRNSQTALQFKRVTLDAEQIMKQRSIREQITSVQGKKGLRVPLPSIDDLPTSHVGYTFGFAKRPLYPRHNRKISKQ